MPVAQFTWVNNKTERVCRVWLLCRMCGHLPNYTLACIRSAYSNEVIYIGESYWSTDGVTEKKSALLKCVFLTDDCCT